MKKVQLVYAEVMNGISEAMRNDPLVAIISDTGVFIVTTEENSQKYDEEFYPVSAEARNAYCITFYAICRSTFNNDSEP